MATPDQHVHIDKQDARSGETPGVVRYVLLISLTLVIVALAAIWITGAANAPDNTGGTADTARAVQEGAQKTAPQ